MPANKTANTFRLFISSTFSDFIAEREALQKVVFPELETYCAQRGARFQAVDLRWGITEEAQREHDTMRICLEEVRRCQQLSPRPNFVVLLGERYGWEPVPARIPLDHWRRLRQATCGADWELIEKSYRLDENAIPPVHCLRERAKDQAVACQHEANLLQALRRAARGFRGSARLPYFASATHQEIVLGALSRRDEQGQALDPQQHVHVYVRHLQDLPNDASAKDFIDWDASTGQVTPGARDRLRGLEKTLRERLPGHVHDLHTAWSRDGRNGAANKAYLKRFCDAFLSHQKALIDAELDSLQQADERQQREQAHQDFGAERARVFAGRKALLARIARYTATGSNGGATRPAMNKSLAAPLILLGGGGSGKSALLARAAQEAVHQAKLSGAVVLQRYIGGVPGTESLMTMLTALTADIASLYGQPEPPTPENAKALAEAFLTALDHASAERPLVLYLDALDQLDKADGAWMLEWLPRELPEHVRVVASARTGTGLEQSARRRYPHSLIDVPAMKPAEGLAMLKAWLADKRAAWFNAGIAPSTGRRLTPLQQQAVLAAFNTNGLALWLKLAYEEAANWSSWDSPRDLPATVQGLIEDLIDRRLIGQENHPKVFTERALAYLTAGRFGLSESELGRALGTDPTVRAEFQANEKTQRKWEDDKQLPPILWSRLYFDLQAYLGMAQVDGALLMRWFHREFGEVLKARYLANAEHRHAIHGALADTFLNLERELRPQETNDDALFRATDAGGKQVSVALRRVMEQPWQLAQAARHEDLQGLLTDFGFCMGKSASNSGADLAEDFSTWMAMRSAASPGKHWFSFMRATGHLLRRGDKQWPAHKILLQVAMECADENDLAIAASRWAEAGHCDWTWLREVRRLAQGSLPCAVLEGHKWSIAGVRVLSDDRLLTWCGGIENEDYILRVWDGLTGLPLSELEGHTMSVGGAQVLFDGRVLSWAEGCSLRLWDSQSGAPLAVLEGHTLGVEGALVLPDGRVLSWSNDATLRLWDGLSGAQLAVMAGHTSAVKGAQVFSDGMVLSWSKDHTLRLWDGQSGVPRAVMEGHTAWIDGAQALPDGRVLSWSDDKTIRLWDGQSGAPLAVMEGHTDWVNGALVIPAGRVLSWSKDHTLRLWDGQSSTPLAVMEGHVYSVNGASVLADGRILSWSDDHTLRLWDWQSGAPLAVLDGHVGSVNGASVLADGRILSWSDDHTLRLWDGVTGAPLNVMSGHTSCVTAVVPVGNNRFISWAADENETDPSERFSTGKWDEEFGDSDHRALIWELDELPQDMDAREPGLRSLAGSLVLNPRQVISWSRFDGGLNVWNMSTGCREDYIEANDGEINLVVASDDRFVTWSEEGVDIKIWDRRSCELLGVLEEESHVESVILLSEERLLSGAEFGSMTLWNLQTFEPLVRLQGCRLLCGAHLLADERIISWDQYGENEIWLWDPQDAEMMPFEIEPGVPVIKMRGHTAAIRGVSILSDGRLLSWSLDGTLRLWDGKTGDPLVEMSGLEGEVKGVRVLTNGHILAWSGTTVQIWDGLTDLPLAVFKPQSRIQEVQVLAKKRFLVMCWHELLVIEDFSRGPLRVLDMHKIDGAKQLSDGRIAAWTNDGALTLWELDAGVTRRYPNPWIESCDCLPSIKLEGKLAGAQARGSIWTQAQGTYMSIVDARSGCVARWHGDIVDVQDYLPPIVIGRNHTQLRFLEILSLELESGELGQVQLQWFRTT